ncbi:MAG: PEP-CTERM sorting domain-containing protein [Pseudomonadota bacterium]
MTLTPRFSPVPAALLGLVLALSCHAALAAPSARASATMSNFNMSVIDLTPDDGVDAAYSLGENQTFSAVTSSIGRNTAEIESGSWNEDATPISAYVAQIGLNANTGAGTWGNLRASSYMNANDGADILGLTVTGEADQFMSVLVSPHTRFNLAGHTDITLDTTGHGFGGVTSFAETSIRFNETFDSFGLGTYYPSSSGSLSRDFAYSYLNDSDSEQFVWVELRVRGQSSYYEAVAPVPEPSAYAMFGLGALMVGAIARRKRRQADAA